MTKPLRGGRRAEPGSSPIPPAACAESAFPFLNQWIPYTISHGNAGLAVLWGYLDSCFPGEGWDVTGQEHVHAAVRSYRWEYGRLPPDLNAVNVGELARDLFTGELLQYEVSGSRYRLASAGPEITGDDPRAGERRPVTLVPEP